MGTKYNEAVELGKNVKFYREKLGLTQDELAQLTGYKTRSAITHIEQGSRNVKTSVVTKLAAALRVSVLDLLGNVEKHEKDDPYLYFAEYIPYLAKADEATLTSIRKLLDMPQVNPGKKSNSDSIKIIS